MEYGQGSRVRRPQILEGASGRVRIVTQCEHKWTDETGLHSSLHARQSQHVALLLPRALPSVTLLNISPQM